MYQLVNESEARKYRRECSSVLTEARAILKEKDISCQFILVGSGARNLITRNDKGPYNLDYNLEIIKAPENIWKDLHLLKETILTALNKANGFDFTEARDSTSVLTCLLQFKNEPKIEFSFDVAIVARNNDGTLCRLIHNKKQFMFGSCGQYTWNEVPNSHNVGEKAQEIKNAGEWERVRLRYVEKKNFYLSNFDFNHPSFIVYVETVNEIYNQLF